MYEKIRSLLVSVFHELVGLVIFAALFAIRGYFRSIRSGFTRRVIMEENKVLEFKIEGEHMILSVDPNKDGEKLLELKIMLKEVPDEVLSAFKK